jgi:hypothetical protein
MSPLRDLSEVLERVLQLQSLPPAAPPTSCREALEHARERASRDAELRDLLAELGAALVDALLAGQESDLVASLVGTLAPVEAEPAGEDAPAVVQPESAPEAAALVEEPPAAIPPADVPRPPSIAITPEVLRALQQRLHQNGLQREVRRSARSGAQHRELLEKVRWYLEAFGPAPAPLKDAAAVKAEAERLVRLVPAPPHHWQDVGKEANHALTSWTAARARAAQDAARERNLPEEVHQLDQLFPRLSRHANKSRPGMVHGLARAHEPLGNSWLDDARGYEQRLRRLLVEEGVAPQAAPPEAPNHDDALRRLTEDLRTGLDAEGFCERAKALIAGGLAPTETRLVRLARPFLADLVDPELAPLRRAVERDLEAEADQVDGNGQLPADWPWLSFTRGKRGAIVGGEPRQERRERLQEVFGFDSLEWLPNPTRGIRRVHALTQQMRAGSLDLVIVLRAFVGHGVSDKVFGAETPSCRTILAENYGVTQVRLGIERFLAGAVPEPGAGAPNCEGSRPTRLDGSASLGPG